MRVQLTKLYVDGRSTQMGLLIQQRRDRVATVSKAKGEFVITFESDNAYKASVFLSIHELKKIIEGKNSLRITTIEPAETEQ